MICMKRVLREMNSSNQYFLWKRNEDTPMLECSSLAEEGSADNLSEFEVIVEAATDKILRKKR